MLNPAEEAATPDYDKFPMKSGFVFGGSLERRVVGGVRCLREK
jgi:hypothetical protein